jgi:hypothetical protein
MARIRCHYADCVFLDDGYCSAAAIELDPDTGCATYSPTEEAAKEDWEKKESDDGKTMIGDDDEDVGRGSDEF